MIKNTQMSLEMALNTIATESQVGTSGELVTEGALLRWAGVWKAIWCVQKIIIINYLTKK